MRICNIFQKLYMLETVQLCPVNYCEVYKPQKGPGKDPEGGPIFH